MFFGPIGKSRWPPWPLIGWDIFDFFSETAEWNSTKTWQEVRSQRPLLSLCFRADRKKQDGHSGFWFAETFSTWLHILLRCTICDPLGLLFITLLKRFESENISSIIPSKRVTIQMQVILHVRINNISSNLANHWVYKRYFSFSAFDGGGGPPPPPRSKVQRSFLTRSLYSGERQWPFGPVVSSTIWHYLCRLTRFVLVLFNDVVWWGFDRKCHRYLLVLIMNVSFLSANWLKMHKMRCIRQVNTNYFPILHNFIEITILGVCWTEKSRNINGNERWNKTTLNIHISLMECTRKLKFGMRIHHYLVNSFGYSMLSYDLDRNFQGHWYRV